MPGWENPKIKIINRLCRCLIIRALEDEILAVVTSAVDLLLYLA